MEMETIKLFDHFMRVSLNIKYFLLLIFSKIVDSFK